MNLFQSQKNRNNLSLIYYFFKKILKYVQVLKKGRVMNENDFKIAKELKLRLTEVANIVDFRVFGSRARGNQDEFSDLDVFIEVENLDRIIKKKIRNITWEIGFENSVFISSLIFTRYEIEVSPLRASPIIKNINEEGVKI